MSASCNRGPNCSLTRAMNGRIVRCGRPIINSCQSAATSEIVKRFFRESDSCKRRYSKYPTFTFETFSVGGVAPGSRLDASALCLTNILGIIDCNLKKNYQILIMFGTNMNNCIAVQVPTSHDDCFSTTGLPGKTERTKYYIFIRASVITYGVKGACTVYTYGSKSCPTATVQS